MDELKTIYQHVQEQVNTQCCRFPIRGDDPYLNAAKHVLIRSATLLCLSATAAVLKHLEKS